MLKHIVGNWWHFLVEVFNVPSCVIKAENLYAVCAVVGKNGKPNVVQNNSTVLADDTYLDIDLPADAVSFLINNISTTARTSSPLSWAARSMSTCSLGGASVDVRRRFPGCSPM